MGVAPPLGNTANAKKIQGAIVCALMNWKSPASDFASMTNPFATSVNTEGIYAHSRFLFATAPGQQVNIKYSELLAGGGTQDSVYTADFATAPATSIARLFGPAPASGYTSLDKTHVNAVGWLTDGRDDGTGTATPDLVGQLIDYDTDTPTMPNVLAYIQTTLGIFSNAEKNNLKAGSSSTNNGKGATANLYDGVVNRPPRQTAQSIEEEDQNATYY